VVQLQNGVRFNREHYIKVFKERISNDGRKRLYCFALGIEMGENGRVENHPLYGKLFECKGKTYTVESVNIHFLNGGYYWFVVFEDENGSSAPRIYENINSNEDFVKKAVKRTQRDFRLKTHQPN
jgi:hypothetical protein